MFLFFLIGQYMPGYPFFLLIGPALIYVPLYFVWLGVAACAKSKKAKAVETSLDDQTPIDPKKTLTTSKLHLHYLGIALCLTISSVVGQYADTYVSADLQAVTQQIALPLTGILARIFGEEKFTVVKVIGGIVVLLGTLVGVVPALFVPQPISSGSYVTNSVFWIILSIAATVPVAIGNVWQEVLFQRYETNVLHLVTWTNFYSLIGFGLSLPLAMIPNFGQGLSFIETLQYQFWAIECFLNVPGPSGCQANAWLPVMLFVIFYLLFNYFLAVVVARESATFQAIVSTLMTPGMFTSYTYIIDKIL